jgi:hypothetical protein
MKRILYSICIGSVALALTAQGATNNDEPNTTRGKARKAQTVQKKATAASPTVSHSRQMRGQRNVTNERFRQRTNVTPRTTSNAVIRENNLRNNRVQTVRNRSVRNTNQVRARNDLTVNRERNLRVNRGGNVAVNRERNFSVNRERNITNNRVNRVRNVTITNNWRGERFSGRQYAAFRNYHREWHDRGWWGSHFPRITFVFGAPYYWNAGYWYPAWGYNPGYYYPYDGPIYGYNNLPPDQVVVNVQSQLQREGYYDGPIDGVLGPMTRQAIAAFQDDHGLAVTSAVDEPTLETLGLV